jgi:hypothetical protein
MSFRIDHPVEFAFSVKCELDVYRNLNKNVTNGNTYR